MAEISKITLPSGNTYDIKDATARQMIAGGVSFIIAWNGASAPTVANIPAGVTVTYNGTDYTGTLAASSAQSGAFYLVKSGSTDRDIYSEYVVIGSTGSKSWEKLGDTLIDLSSLGNLAYKDNVTLNKGDGDVVLGEGTTFTNASSAVTFSGGTTDKVLGSDATFTTTVTPTTTNIKATASGVAVAANGTATAVTGYPNVITEQIFESSATYKGLKTSSITGTNGTETVSAVTKTASKLVTTSVPNVTNAGSASTWSFAIGSGDDAETLIISGTNSVAPTLGAAITAATGAVASNGAGSDVVTGVTISDKTVAKAAASATTVFTGVTAADYDNAEDAATGAGTGGVGFVSEMNVNNSYDFITSLGSPSTSSVLTGVQVTSQPTVSLSTGATAGAGVISVATGITSASTTTDNKDEVTAVTGIGTGTAAAQTITVGTGDKVTVAKYSDLSTSVS